MKLFAASTFNHIRKQIVHQTQQIDAGRKIIVTMPSISPEVALEICKMLEDYCTEDELLSPPLIKIANQLFQDWSQSENPQIINLAQEVASKDWNDKYGNLTKYRNAPLESRNEYLVVLLIGVEQVTDSSSLADFHKCDIQTIWIDEMGGSFDSWTKKALKEASIGFEDETVAHFNQILKALVELGVADILQVSTFIEELDFNIAQDGRDAEEIILSSLGQFGLPKFTQYKFSSRREFGSYLELAVSFFTYNMFIEERSRINTINTVDKFLQHNQDRLEQDDFFDENERKSYVNDVEFIKDLRFFVETANPSSLERLLDCDFTTIWDKILNFKFPREKREPIETIKKLSGSPIEVVLTGLWITFSEFKKEASDKGVFAYEIIKRINIESKLFKHDCEGDSSDERKRKALSYLEQLLGGVDKLIEEGIDLSISNEDDSPISINSALVNDKVDCQPSRIAEPYLQFSIEIEGEDWDRPVMKQFSWRLPEIQQYRVAEETLQWAAQHFQKEKGFCFPVFFVPYYEELMMAKNEEETRRVFLQCVRDEGNNLYNLLGANDIQKSDPLHKKLEKTAFEYDHFLQQASTKGLHYALGDSWIPLRKAYEELCEAYIIDPECGKSPLASLVFRAFLFIQNRDSAEGERWIWDSFEPSGIITILHPALLEMLQAQVLYLLSSFNSLVHHELRAPGTRSFSEMIWRNYVDLASIQMPLCGLIKDRNRILDTDVRGKDLIHRIGEASDKDAALTTRLLLRYDAFEDEDVTDIELFRKSRESLLIFRILWDYRELHPHVRDDGFSIAVYQNDDIQPVIAAIDQFLSKLSKNRDNSISNYNLSVTVFTESSDDTCVSRWIEQWKERWEAAETQSSLSHYRNVTLSVAHRIVSSDKYYKQFRELILAGLEVDIAFLNRFIGAGLEGNDFEIVDPYDVTSRTLKFPILEKSFCSLKDPGKQLQRARVLSNRQFRISTWHAEVMARLKNREAARNTHHVVLGFGDYTPWQGVVDELHLNAEWVVCIDPNVDERLIAQKSRKGDEEREIIGFGSGVGSHGEDNFTISTEQFRLSDILDRLTASIGEVYSGWDPEIYKSIAKGVLSESKRLSGLSLVRATGISHYIRDFMAYALARKLLEAAEDVLCDQIVSLDAYRHWFDTADSDTRPDLLWIVAKLGSDGRIHLDLRLVECKVAKMSDAHLEKAHQQIENGLRHLIAVFIPRINESNTEDERPDQRYWWLQLHRLIASKAEISSRDQPLVLSALERLAEGDYNIEWRAAALTFWTDQQSSELVLEEPWEFTFDDQQLGISVVSAGRELVRSVCTSDNKVCVPWDDSKIEFKSTKYKSPVVEEGKRDDDDEGMSSMPHLEESPKKKRAPELPSTGHERIPERILLGTTLQGSRRVYWEFGHQELSNRHMLIFGTSGMGKTYTIQCLLYELGRYGQNSLILDYTNGFFDNQLEEELKNLVNPVQHYVQRNPLAINPFRRLDQFFNNEAFPEESSSTAQRVAGVFSEVYNFGDQQKSALYQAIKNGIDTGGDVGISLKDLIPLLEEISEQRGTIANAAGSVISKIRPFIDQSPFGAEDPESWERLFTDSTHRCHILQLAGFIRDASRLITEFSLIDLYWFYRNRGTKENPRVIVLDEIQNLDHREESPLAQLISEGRKFGFSLIMATQIMSNLEKDERDRLFNAAHKLFFRPTDTEMNTYANIAAMSTDEKPDIWKKRLASLKKGECYSLGPSLNKTTNKLDLKTFRIRIASFGDRSKSQE